MTPQRDSIREKIKGEANRQLDPRMAATERLATVSGLGLCLIIAGDQLRGPWADWVSWLACLGLLALWVGHEVGARQAWQLHEQVRSLHANRVALWRQRNALARELLGRGYLLIAYVGGFDVWRQGGPWLVLVIFAAGVVYLVGLALLIARVEWRMRAALRE